MTEELRKIAEQHVPIRGKHKSKERNRLESALQEAKELIVRRAIEVLENYKPPGETPLYCSRQQLVEAILREFGVKE